MATKQELQREVSRLNRKYCKNTKNYLRVDQAYGGYEVQLAGKEDKRYKKKYKLLKGAMPGAYGVCGDGHDSATKTLNKLRKADEKGYIKYAIRRRERRR